jgi:hypothetical protein
MDLREFEKQNKTRPGPRCTVCALSAVLREELAQAEERGTSRSVMSKYLKTHGFSIQNFTIGDHFRKGHDKKETQ